MLQKTPDVKILVEMKSFAADATKLKVNIVEVLKLIRQSWEAVTGKTVKNCFKTAGFLQLKYDDVFLEESKTAACNGIAPQNLSVIDYECEFCEL